MNYFFMYLIPQLLEYFNGDVEKVKEFLPVLLTEKYDMDLIENQVPKLQSK